MTLGVDEFLRRFLLHVLPRGFLRIRHFGLLANRRKADALTRCRELLDQPAPVVTPRESAVDLLRRLTGTDPTVCPVCHQGRMTVTAVVVPATPVRPPPPVTDTS